MYTIVWRNRDDLDTISLDDVYNHLKVYEPEVQKKSETNSQNMAFISSSDTSSGKGKVHTASNHVSTASTDVAAASISHDTVCAYIASQSNDKFWKKTGKNITIQGSDVAGFDKSKVERFNCHKMGHFARKCRAPRSQDRGKRESYRQGPKEEEQAPKALMAIDGIGWDWSYMANEEENHALVVDEEVPTEFSLMKAFLAKEEEQAPKAFCLKEEEQAPKALMAIDGIGKNTKNLNNKITKLNEELSDSKTNLYHYKLGLSQVEARFVEFKTQEIKFCEKIRGLKRDVEFRNTKIKNLMNELEQVKKEKEGLDSKLTGFLEFANDTVTDHSRPMPSIDSSKSNTSGLQNTDSPGVIKTNKTKTARKPPVKYAEMYRNTSIIPKVRGNQRNWNNLKSQQLGKDFVMQNKACFKFGHFDHLAYDYGVWVEKGKNWPKKNFAHKNVTPRSVLLKTDRTPIAGNSQNNIDGKGYWDSGCSRHMTGNIYYLSEYEPYDGGYVSFGQGGGKITGKGIIKTGKLEFENVYFVKELKLGHLNFKTMNKLVRNNLVKGLPSKCFENDHTCIACLKGKQHKASCKTKLVNYVSKPLHTLHMDLFGPTSISSLNHKWYCLGVTDDFPRFTWTFFLRTKDETSVILRNFITNIENLKDLKVKIIRCDNGGGFKNKEMNELCTKKGIKREFSKSRTAQQNGVAERRNRTLIEAARTMLADTKLPVTFWAEAVNTACYVQNRVLVNKSQNKTPYELFNSRTPVIGFLRPFRFHVMILNTLDQLGKFDAKGDEGYFVGYSMSSKAFRVFNKRTKKVEENMHVDFLMNKLIEKGAGPNWLFDINTLTNSMNYVPVVVAGTSSTNISAHMESYNNDAQDACNTDAPESSGISNPTATSKIPPADQMESLIVEFAIPTVSLPVPTACLDTSPKTSSGSRLISKEVLSQEETPSLDNALTLSNRFEDTIGVEAHLRNIESSIPASLTPTFRIHKDHPKSQIIGPVDTPEEGIDYDEVFTPVARIEAIRLFLAYASFMRFTVYQMDVKSAFLYGTIDEEVYVMKPPGFHDLEFTDRVYKVEKAMYGLHQAPRAWYGTMSKYLLDNGFQRGTIDQTLFIRKHRGDFLLVQVYVDDIIFVSSNPLLCREFKALMHDMFQMSTIGELNFFLGLQVLQKKNGIFLSQDKYVGDILKKFGYSDVSSVNAPMDKENPWGKDRPGIDVELHLYRFMMGSLMYLTASRPDIMFAASACARHQVTPKECHIYGVKRIFRYLKGHPKLGLWYPKVSPFDLVAYSDSDYGGATQDRKSTTGWCQFLGRRLISWQCKK
nr:putative ribonuclease H-like domain-containing protein [Tanacetum cinerariifolium]